jgi:two-component system sensor histidine kinase PilS (NtrC family)
MFAKPGRFHAERADLVTLLKETLSLLENSEERRPHHRVVSEFHPASIPVEVDVNRMKQVFWNLVRNSLTAMPQGGTLTVKALDGLDGQVTVRFADTGVGMSESEIASNFQPFHGSFESGTGLGLAIVYRIIEEHGGRIKVRSRPGAGTEVDVHLPRRSAAARPAEERRWTGS